MSSPCRTRIFLTAFALPLLASATLLLAHGGENHEAAPPPPEHWWALWTWEPVSAVGLALSGWLYGRGVRRLWRDSRWGGGIRPWEVGAYAAGWLALFAALLSPIHPWGRYLFTVHMTQHEILMTIAAPLLVLGKPLAAFLKALPIGMARRLVHATGGSAWRHTWHAISNPFIAFLIHAAALWVWHIPSLFESVLDNEWLHALQHCCFLFTALLFWWAVMQGRSRVVGYGMAVLYMFMTSLHSGLLGALLTFSQRLWYPAYAHTTSHWGLTPLEDQQMAGLIMWIPACIAYIIAGLALFASWLRESELRVLRREARLLGG